MTPGRILTKVVAVSGMLVTAANALSLLAHRLGQRPDGRHDDGHQAEETDRNCLRATEAAGNRMR